MSSAPEQKLREKSGHVLISGIPVTDLFKIIFGKLQPLFSIDCCTLLIYNEKITSVQEAYTAIYDHENGQLEYVFTTAPSALSDRQKEIARYSFPVIKTADDWLQEQGDGRSSINIENDYQYHCYIPLEIENQTIGTLGLHNQKEELTSECLAFSSNIADIVVDIIDFQNTNYSPVKDFSKQKSDAVLHSEIATSEQLAKLDNIDNLTDFIARYEEVFPASFAKIKLELEDLNHYKAKLENEREVIVDKEITHNNYTEIVGAGSKMNAIFALMDHVAGSESTVLIMGETGTGKELIARGIHENSPRKSKPMVKVNCAAIPANLIESELFGHEKGAFTGAMDKRIGKFELADNSTLFLDEIGELPLDLQVKLLRVLQEKEIERVGGKTTIKTDVRIIAATNRNLLAEVERGNFRQDLYFRLNVFPIALPSLKERVEDIPLLASHFLAKYATKAGKPITGFTNGAINQMKNYDWPGNVREMEHLIERQVLINTKPLINSIEIPVKEKTITGKDGSRKKIKTIDENERDHIFEVLKLCKGKVSGKDGAAKLLGVPATTLNSKMKRLGLGKVHF
jgi:transcriptional regulator with GAF, ATPase, and Fis domain